MNSNNNKITHFQIIYIGNKEKTSKNNDNKYIINELKCENEKLKKTIENEKKDLKDFYKEKEIEINKLKEELKEKKNKLNKLEKDLKKLRKQLDEYLKSESSLNINFSLDCSMKSGSITDKIENITNTIYLKKSSYN